jgi:hypothetical protein
VDISRRVTKKLLPDEFLYYIERLVAFERKARSLPSLNPAERNGHM